MIQLLQNTSPQTANGLQTTTVLSILITGFMYHLLVISTYIFSSIIIIISLLDILVKTKYWNLFAMNISSPVFTLISNNSASFVLLVYKLSYNVISPTDLSNNFLFLNNYEILFLWTSLRNFHHYLDLTLFWL